MRLPLPAALVVTLALAACGGDELRAPAQSGPTGPTTPADGAGGQRPIPFAYAGARGPARWGALSRRYAECSDGSAQSPIELANAVRTQLPNLRFDYRRGDVALLNTTHTVQVEETPGSQLFADGDAYPLLQFHVHEPSEHTVAGKRFDAELHFVHRDAEGHVAVVGVLVRRGRANPGLGRVFDAMPTTAGAAATLPDFDLASLLPAGRRFTTYGGSLTTPPCNEGVRWYVLSSPVEASPEQLAEFRALFDANARPVQPRGGRTVRVDAG